MVDAADQHVLATKLKPETFLVGRGAQCVVPIRASRKWC